MLHFGSKKVSSLLDLRSRSERYICSLVPVAHTGSGSHAGHSPDSLETNNITPRSTDRAIVLVSSIAPSIKRMSDSMFHARHVPARHVPSARTRCPMPQTPCPMSQTPCTTTNPTVAHSFFYCMVSLTACFFPNTYIWTLR